MIGVDEQRHLSAALGLVQVVRRRAERDDLHHRGRHLDRRGGEHPAAGRSRKLQVAPRRRRPPRGPGRVSRPGRRRRTRTPARPPTTTAVGRRRRRRRSARPRARPLGRRTPPSRPPRSSPPGARARRPPGGDPAPAAGRAAQVARRAVRGAPASSANTAARGAPPSSASVATTTSPAAAQCESAAWCASSSPPWTRRRAVVVAGLVQQEQDLRPPRPAGVPVVRSRHGHDAVRPRGGVVHAHGVDPAPVRVQRVDLHGPGASGADRGQVQRRQQQLRP